MRDDPPTTRDLTGDASAPAETAARVRGAAWRAVVGFGVVSLSADMVYEGARSVYGPLLASLGATSLVVGVVSGAGEATALVMRLVFGSLADQSGRYWMLTMLGYGLTAVCVPLLAVTPYVGGAGLVLACALLLGERLGKAVRSPAKSALLARAAEHVGMGRGMGVHKALDQVGAFAGPLLVAAVVSATGVIPPAMAVLVVPGAVAMGLLVWIRARSPQLHDPEHHAAHAEAVLTGRLPRRFHLFAASAGAATAGLVTFGIVSFHLVHEHVVPLAAVPVVYAVGMAAEAVIALVTGWGYDRVGPRVLLGLPFLVAAVPLLAFSASAAVALAGVVVWGMATGLQDSTVKALVADLVPAPRRATAYGVFAAVQGAAALAGGTLAGALYSRSLPALVVVVALTQVVSFGLLVATLRRAD